MVRPVYLGLGMILFVAACTPDRAPASKSADSPQVAAVPDAAVTRSEPVDAGATAKPPFIGDSNSKDAPEAPVAASDPNPTIGATPPGVDADDVREAVFRHMFGSNASGQGTGAGVYCLELESQRDPTAGFLARLKDLKKPIRPVSGCSASAEHGVIDKKTGAHGLVFRIESVAFKDARHATVNGGYYEAGLSASGNIYTVELKANGWVVTKDQMTWIS